MSLALISLYAMCGILSGFFSGLLGIGGGLVVVPLLALIFEYELGAGHPHLMHIVVATSLSASIFTAIASARAHAKRGAVNMKIVKTMFPALVLGASLGIFMASFFSSDVLTCIIIAFLFFTATQIFFNLGPEENNKQIPNIVYRIVAITFGCISSLVGLAGGSLFVPFLKYTGLDIHVVIGTTSALTFATAATGAIGYAISGIGVEGLPANNLGHINLPAMLTIALTSIMMVPLGVKISHMLPVNILRKSFAVLLYITATNMLLSVIK